jgi:Ca2+-transporting ATPase
MREWYLRSISETLDALQVDPQQGLDTAEAARRQAEHGPNVLLDKGAKSPWRILWAQFSATMVLILIGAGLLSIFLGKATESISIFAIVILFGLLGFVQEYRAERAMAALKQLSVPNVRVRRNGKVSELAAPALTVGDIVLLEAGNVIPADLRLLETNNLRIQEAALTGESEGVIKMTAPLDNANAPLGDRRNVAYMGTTVEVGRGLGVVTAVGMQAELGKIATMLQSVQHEATPLQQRLDKLGKLLALAGVGVALLIMAIGLWRGEALSDMLLTAVSVAVAIIPEGLPAVVTFTLALGARRMLQRNALIRKLPAVETLGSVTTICSDKTGTLTENRMTVVVLDIAGHRIEIDETIRENAPAFMEGEGSSFLRHSDTAEATKALALLLMGGALCNDAEVEQKDGRLQTIGDPTEGALLVAGKQGGVHRSKLEPLLPRIGEIPFDSERKRMTTLHRRQAAPAQLPVPLEDELIAFTKGAVDSLIDCSTHVWDSGTISPLDDAYRQRVEEANAGMAANGMRVLGVAYRPVDEATAKQPTAETVERDLIFIGFFGIIDPPRTEVRDAVALCRQAGIRPVMITGDHPLTARYIARDLGIIANNGDSGNVERDVLTGAVLQQMDDDALAAQVEQVSVYARVSPEHKLRIVRALQSKGHIAAMTGDGVNDAPALKQADIGVAMGITGTDVTKEAAEMVLRDDNFATIVAAVEEGRTIYDNIRRFVKFSVAGNVGKVAVMLFAPFLGIGTALLPLQLLWLNLLTDGLLGLGMGFEPTARDAMQRPPISPKAGIFSDGMGRHVIWVGLLIGAIALGTGYLYYQQGLTQWQMMIFNTLAFAQIGQALASRSNRDPIWRIGFLSNRPLLIMLAVVVVAQVVVLLLPALERFFYTEALRPIDWVVSVGAGLVVFITVEVEKLFLRRRSA